MILTFMIIFTLFVLLIYFFFLVFLDSGCLLTAISTIGFLLRVIVTIISLSIICCHWLNQAQNGMSINFKFKSNHLICIFMFVVLTFFVFLTVLFVNLFLRFFLGIIFWFFFLLFFRLFFWLFYYFFINRNHVDIV